MKNKGFTLFIAIIVTGVLLLIGTGLVNLATKQALISSSGQDSQHAFYAADTGIECALYWDVKNPAGFSAFSTSTGSTINCNRNGNNSSNQWVVGGNSSGLSTIDRINFLPDPYCAIVTVNKTYASGRLVTTIVSKGYNNCNASNPRRMERAVRATYSSAPPPPPPASPPPSPPPPPLPAPGNPPGLPGPLP